MNTNDDNWPPDERPDEALSYDLEEKQAVFKEELKI